MKLFSRLRRSIHRLTSTGTGTDITTRSDIDPDIARKLQEVSAGERSMTEQLLNDGFGEIGDIVQGYCDHPAELQDEYLDGNWLHRSCECGAYLGIVEDQ